MKVWDYLLGRELPAKVAPRKRSYQAANTGRLFSDFMASNKSADSELRNSLVIIRNRSRDLARNDVYVKRYISLLETNVVGEQGVNIQVKARNSDSSLDTIGNQIIENSFFDWGRYGNCTADGKMSWIDVQKYIIAAVARDGEAIIEIVRSPVFKYGFAINIIESDLIDEQRNMTLDNGHQIRMGIEVDQYQRPVAYWIKQKHPGDYDMSGVNQNVVIRVPADRIIHVYKPLRAGQTRGEPWLAPAMSQLKMLNAHREAELVASRMAASKMGFFTSPAGDEFNADEYDGNVPIIDAEPGTFHQLPAGVDFKPFDPTHPSTAFHEFQKGILRGIASGLGVSYASLSNDLEGTSYSSIRQGALEERDAYKMQQQFLIDHFIFPIYSEWLRHVMEFGKIPIPATKYDKFFNDTIFRGRSWQWVDPQREIGAIGQALQLGIMAPQDAMLQYGREAEEVYSQWQRDKELAQTFNLNLAFEPFGGAEAAKGVVPQTPGVQNVG